MTTTEFILWLGEFHPAFMIVVGYSFYWLWKLMKKVGNYFGREFMRYFEND